MPLPLSTQALDNLTEKEKEALIALLESDVVQFEMGAENWDLTEEQEMVLWDIIHRIEES